jgi:YD repeat-containing protein
MTGHRVLETVAGWNITRWEYDGARLGAEETERRRHRSAVTLDIDDKGESMTIEWENYGYDGGGTQSVSVPLAVLRRVLEGSKEAAEALAKEGKPHE